MNFYFCSRSMRIFILTHIHPSCFISLIISAWHCSACEVPQLKKCFLSFVMCFINTNVTQFLHCHCQPHSVSYFFYLTFPVYLPSNLPSLPFYYFRNQWIQRNKLLSWILILISILDKQDDPNQTGKKYKLVQLWIKSEWWFKMRSKWRQ